MNPVLGAARAVLNALFVVVYGVWFWLLLVLDILLMALLLALIPGVERRRATASVCIRGMLWLGATPLRRHWQAPLPEGPCVVVANHASYLDGLLMTAALPPRFRFVIKEDAARWPLIGWMLRRLGACFIHRDAAHLSAMQMRSLIRSLRAGDSLVIFPEGTFERAEGLLPFRPGAFIIASRGEAPVVPALILGSRQLLREGNWLPRYSRVSVDFLPPVAPSCDSQQLATEVRAQILALYTRHVPNPEIPPSL